MKTVIRNVFLFIVGFFSYIMIENIWRGYSYVMMGICGGLAFVILDRINSRISWDVDLLVQGLCGSVLITSFELVIGEIALNTTLLPVMWDYSGQFLNFDGVICPLFSFIWFLLSIVVIFIADAINYYWFGEMPVPYYKIFGKTVIRFKTKNRL